MEDNIYFGSYRVTYDHVEGDVIAFKHDDWEETFDPEILKQTLSRSERQSEDDSDSSVADIVVPAIPALDVVLKEGRKTSKEDLSSLPEFLRRPVMKVKTKHDSSPYGVASGCRSGLLRLDGKWYRLKGCGNNDEGFVVRVNAPGELRKEQGAWRDIRGSAFPHTALRELLITSETAAALEKEGIIGCNKALGMAIYKEIPLGKKFPIACIIEQTFGDRRFGTHVLAGLELLLPSLIEEGKLDAEEKLLSMFPKNRPGRQSMKELVDTGALLMDFMMGTTLAGNAEGMKGLEWPDTPRDSTTFTSIIDARLPECSPDSTVFPQQWTAKGSRDMADEWKEEWSRTCEMLKSELKDIGGQKSVLAYLFSRCGYDAGRIMKGMHKMRISWGTYQDQMCIKDLDEWHCNAHANNLVVIKENSIPECQSFLSYLDLDMAFSEKSFVDCENGKVGLSEDQFSHLLWREHVNFMECLCGVDSSNGVPRVAQRAVEERTSPALSTVKISLYDTLIHGYLRAYENDDQFKVASFDAKLQHAAYLIIRLAIIIMADYVA